MKIKKVTDTQELAAFWAFAERAAVEVAAWPVWMKGGSTIGEKNSTEDLRKTALKNGLRQLTIDQLRRVANYNGIIACDYGNYVDGRFCAIAIGLGLDQTMTEPTNDKVRADLIARGLKIDNLKGVPGTFYTKDRRADLDRAVAEVIHEKFEAGEDGDPYANGARVVLERDHNARVSAEERERFKLAFHTTFARLGPDLVKRCLSDLNMLSMQAELKRDRGSR